MHEQTQNCDDQSIFLIFFISFIFKNSFKGRISKNFLHLQIMRRCQLKNRPGHTVVTMELMLWEIVLKQPHKRLLLRLERNPEHHSYAKKGVNHDIPQSSQTRCLEITEKVSFNTASEASYVFILSGQKFTKNVKNDPFLRNTKMIHFGWFSNSRQN